MGRLQIITDHPEFWPDMERQQPTEVTEKQLLLIAITELKQRTGASTRQIAEFLDVPKRTVDDWVTGRALPPDWCCKKLRKELADFSIRD